RELPSAATIPVRAELDDGEPALCSREHRVGAHRSGDDAPLPDVLVPSKRGQRLRLELHEAAIRGLVTSPFAGNPQLSRMIATKVISVEQRHPVPGEPAEPTTLRIHGLQRT